jgi:SAM-dependent methyltransferase
MAEGYNPRVDWMLEATARAEDDHFWFRGLRRNARILLKQQIRGRTDLRIVDCGTGTGRNLDWLREFGFAVGVEQSLVGVRFGHERGRPVVRASVARLPVADSSMDVATSFDVLYCLDDHTEVQAVREMWRVLRPGGILIVNAAALALLRGSHSALTMEQRRYTSGRLDRLLTTNGFDVLRLTFTNMTTFPLTLASRLVDRARGRTDVASDADLRVPPAPLNAVLNAAGAADAVLLRFINLPIGSSLMAVARKRTQ